MIVFDLGCADGHVFEAWFGSTEDYDSQRVRGLVTCPICGSSIVDKAVMAPRISAKANSRPDTAPVPVAAGHGAVEQIKTMMRAMAEAQAKALEGSVYVGRGFADEARAMHLGEAEHRSVHGQATVEEAKSLLDDGIPVAPLPFPVRPPGSEN